VNHRPEGNIGEAYCRLIVFPSPFQYAIVVNLSVSPGALPQLTKIFSFRDKTRTKKKNKQGKQELEPAGLNQKELFHSLLYLGSAALASGAAYRHVTYKYQRLL
jgi:hypothetical protein